MAEIDKTVKISYPSGALEAEAGPRDASATFKEFPRSLISAYGLAAMGEVDATSKTQSPRQIPPSGIGINELQERGREFTLVSEIGRGGQGVVYEAIQNHLGRRVAVKQALEGEDVVESFIKESLTAAQLDHPGIVPVHDLGVSVKEDGTRVPFLAMKRVRGRSWKDIIAEEREVMNFSLDRFLLRHIPIFVDLANAVAYAHSKKIIHRDLKPGQVMVGDYGEVYLLDWGLAVFLGGGEEEPLPNNRLPSDCFFTLDSATNPAGSPAYMAPEQTHLGTGHLSFQTDIYLLGAVLYELLTGFPPHRAPSVRQALLMAENNNFAPLPPDAPEELGLIVHWCMKSDPRERPESALQVRELVEAWLTGAGKKDESRLIAHEVAAMDLSKLCDYTELSNVGRRLAHAAQGWPDNPAIAPLRQRLLMRFAEVALDRHDFLLANLQASRLSDPQVSAMVMERLEEARENFSRSLKPLPLFTPLRVVLFLLLATLVSATLYIAHKAAERSALNEIQSKVASLAALTAMEVNPAHLVAVDRDRQIDTSEFQAVLSRLNTIRRANDDVRYVYTLRPDESDREKPWITLVDADPLDLDLTGDGVIDVDGNPPGNEYPFAIQAMWDAWEGTDPTSGILIDSWGEFISGFAAVRDRQTGRPVAIAAVDFEKSLIDDRLRSARVTGAIAGLLILALLAATFIAWSASRRALERARVLQARLEHQEKEAQRKDVYLG